ncbi:putative ascorbate ferrireductase (transmembrane) [Rosa chinensis]|uniref:ascorbate ferrireductase (transmembrane) n=1 Tax=Rosa chinensis TaxID=74649 RepID=A0A2P6R3J1_ROSCH|nr:putative ascorbate ferrireductase (transmembrane) [Rosa chinensis]
MAPKSRSFQVSATPVTIIAHLLLIAITTLLLVWLVHLREGFAFNSSTKAKIFNVLISTAAIMAYKTIPGKRDTQKVVHMILHLLALVSVSLGLFVIIKYKNEVGETDFISLHSWLGIITISLFGLQWLFGFVAYIFPGSEMSTRPSFKPWHTFLGMVIFLLAVCTAEIGLNYFVLGINQEGLIVNFTGLLIFLFAAAVSLTVLLPRLY